MNFNDDEEKSSAYSDTLNEIEKPKFNWQSLLSGLGSAVATYHGRDKSADMLKSVAAQKIADAKAARQAQINNYFKGRELVKQDKDNAFEEKARANKEITWGREAEEFDRLKNEWKNKDEDRAENKVRRAKDDAFEDKVRANKQVEWGRNAAEFARVSKDHADKKAKESPDAPRAIFAKQKVAKEFDVPVEDLQHMNYDETLEMYKLMKKDPQKAQAIYQRFTSDDGKGNIKQFTFNQATGKAEPLAYPTGNQLLGGLAPKLHSATGELISSNQGSSPTIELKTTDGTSIADKQTELEAKRAEARTTGTALSKTKTDIATAKASLDRVTGSEKRWTELYTKALKEGDAGFIGGRWGAAKNSLGISGSPAGDQLRAEIASETNKLRHELYGSALTATEKEGLAAELASVTQDPKLFATRMKSWVNKYQKAVADAEARLSYMQPQSAAPAASGPKEIRKPYKGRTAVFNADTKEFIRYED